MFRAAFPFLAGVSLLACIVVSALWAHSYRYPVNRAGGDSLNFSRHDPLWWVISARGKITLCRQQGRDWGKEFPDLDVVVMKIRGLRGPNGSLYNVVVPHWFAAAVLTVPPLGWLLFARRPRRRRGRCATCGYDLRATPSQCPECGTAVAST